MGCRSVIMDLPPSATTRASAVNPMPPFDFNVMAFTPPEDDAVFDATLFVRLSEILALSFPAWFAFILNARTPAG